MLCRHLFLGLPFFSFPALAYTFNIFLVVSSPSCPITWPYHLSRFFLRKVCHLFDVGFSPDVFILYVVLLGLAFAPAQIMLAQYLTFFSSDSSHHLGSPQWSSMVLTIVSCRPPSFFPVPPLSCLCSQHPSTLSSSFPVSFHVHYDIICLQTCSTGRLLTFQNHLIIFLSSCLQLRLLLVCTHFRSCLSVSHHKSISTSSFHLHLIS